MTLMTAGPKTLTNPWIDEINDLAQFAATMRPVQIVSSLPSTGMAQGDIVFLTTDNKLYRYTGSAWSKQIFAADLGDQVQAGNLAANSVTAGKIAAGAIDSMTITGALIQTTSTANRGIKLTSTALKGYNGAGAETFSLTASDGSLSLTGAITTGVGSVISTGYLNGTIALANLDVANRGWSQTCAFSVTDNNTIAWGTGVFMAADGTAYNIHAGNTGNMAAKTYIYLNTAVSTTAYQTTTTATTAVGAGKVLIAIAQNGTNEATFMVMNGQGAKNIDASEIVAGSITANEIAASTITGGKIAAATITADNIAASTITGAKIAASTITADNIAASTITGAKIAASTITADKLSASYVQVGGAAADVNSGVTTISGGKITADSIDVGQLKADCITAEKIKAGEIEYTHMGAGAVSADRGDPSGYDFTSFTQDGKWHDLDLSSIVPVGYRFVLLRCTFRAAAAGNFFIMRKKGNKYTQNAAYYRAPLATTYLSVDLLVACDADRKVQYMTQSGYFTSINLCVAAYWP
jgi:hypothetical protein